MPLKKKELRTELDLTPKQRMFVEIYVKDWGNITQAEALKRAGYVCKNENDYDKFNGIKETEHNFLKANNLVSRFKKSNKFIISELGFGTGLSFLMTLKLWKKTKKPNAKLIFISFESAPLTKIELKKVYKYVKGLKTLSSQLIKKLPSIYKSTHRIFFEADKLKEHHMKRNESLSAITIHYTPNDQTMDNFQKEKHQTPLQRR